MIVKAALGDLQSFGHLEVARPVTHRTVSTPSPLNLILPSSTLHGQSSEHINSKRSVGSPAAQPYSYDARTSDPLDVSVRHQLGHLRGPSVLVCDTPCVCDLRSDPIRAIKRVSLHGHSQELNEVQIKLSCPFRCWSVASLCRCSATKPLLDVSCSPMPLPLVASLCFPLLPIAPVAPTASHYP